MLLDVGANVDSKPSHLRQFAVMGHFYAREILGEFGRTGDSVFHAFSLEHSVHPVPEHYEDVTRSELQRRLGKPFANIVGADFADDGTLYLLERKLVVGIWWQSRIRRVRLEFWLYRRNPPVAHPNIEWPVPARYRITHGPALEQGVKTRS